jgi:autotransporter-associated beta strand protein
MKKIMKNNLINGFLEATLFAAVILGMAAQTASAQSGVWTNKANGNWSAAINWAGGTIASGQDNIADFASVIWTNGHQTTLDAPYTVGTLKFGSVGNVGNTNYLLGANTLTLQTSTGNPTINASNQVAIVGAPLASSQPVSITGNIVVVTNAANNTGQTGGWTLQLGQSGFLGQSALGGGPVTVGNAVGSGGVGFNLIDTAAAGTAPVTLSNNFTIQTIRWIAGQSGCTYNAQPVTILGNVFLNSGLSNVRDIAVQNSLTLGGVVSGGGNYGVIIGALGGTLNLTNSGNTFGPAITLNVAGTIGANSDGALGLFNNPIKFTSASGTFRALSSFVMGASRQMVFTAAGNIDTTTNTLEVDGPITGAGAITKNGTGTLNVTAANTFTGGLTVNAGTFEVSGSGSLATAAALTVLTNVTLLFQDSASVPNVASYTVNNGGKFILAGSPTIKSTAPITVNAGGLVDVSGLSSLPFTINSGETLSGGGAVNGAMSFASGANIVPGTAGTAGTLTFSNDLSLSGQTIQFDVSTNTVEGSGTNDEIVVGGNLNLVGGEKIVLNYVNGALSAGTYKLIKFGGTLTGTFALAAAYPNVTIDNGVGTPGYVTLVVSAASIANNLFWKGDGSGNVWDANTTANWVTNFANAALTYNDPSKVTFDNNGSNNVAINLSATVLPNVVTFSNTKPYTISGSGKISGPVAVTVAGVATNTLLTENDYAGGTIFTSGGTLQLGNGGASGAVGSGTVALGSTSGKLMVNRSAAISFPISSTGGTPQVIQNGSGTTTLTGTADDAGLTATVNAGILQLAKTSSGTVHGVSNAIVNAGGTLQLGGTGGDQILNSTPLTLLGGALDLGAQTETVNVLTGYGSVINGGTLNVTTYVGLTNAGTLGITNSTMTVTTASAQWLRDPGSVVFDGGTLNLPSVCFAGVSALPTGTENIYLNCGLTTAGNGETIFGENTDSSVVTIGPSFNGTVWFWSYRDAATNIFWYNGGNLAVHHFNYRGANNGAAQSIHYFNGTTFTARIANPVFLTSGDGSHVKFYVSTNGLIINDAGFALGIPTILAHDPALGVALDGGLTKSGSSTLSLTATNTFNGSVTVNGGALQLNNAGAYNNVTFADNTTYQVNVVSAGVSLTNNSLTLGTSGGGTQNLIFSLGTLGIPTQPVVRVKNILTNSGPVVITITAPFLSPGIAPLIKYGSMDAANFAATWSVAAFPYVNLTLTNDTVNKVISVIVDPGVTPKWKGNISSAWDTTTLNWTSNAIAALYAETTPPGQPVTFDNTAVNFNVDISTATVNPLFVNVTNSTAYTFSGTLGIAGTGALLKNGSGSLTFSNASGANTYSGITTVNGGSIIAALPNVLSPNSAMTLNNSTLNIGANNQTIGAVVLNNTALIGTGTLNNGSLTFNNGATSSTVPPLSGILNLAQNGTGTLTLSNANTWGGELDINAGTVRVNDVGSLGLGGFLSATLTRVQTNAALVFDGANGTSPEYIHLVGTGPNGGGALVVTNGNVTLNGGNITILDDNATINIGANASLTNVIPFSGFPLTKIGGGLLYLGTASQAIIANAGTTIVTASSGRATVNSGGTFGGAGTVPVVDVKSGGVLAPGNLGIGTMTVSDSLTNAGNITMEISYNGVATSADRVNVATNLIYGGTLTVTSVGPNPLAAGNSFKLFNAPSYLNGSFSSVTLPTLASGLGWTNKLAIDGTIAVVATVSTTPFPIGSVVNGGNLELTWPADHTGWRLQVQTNSLSTGLNTNWSDVAGATLVNSMTNTINAANGSVFYRMVYP